MANFMGPMAPPQAAPSTPPQLDIRTNPGQRAQFKEFMQSMNRPVMPPTTAPIAPMLPAPMPSPMDQIDIFAPAPMASGGVVGGLQDLGTMSDQMVEALNTVVYGGNPGGGGFSGGIGGPMSSGGGFGGGQMPPPLPPITAAPFTPTPPNPSGPTFGTRPNEFNPAFDQMLRTPQPSVAINPLGDDRKLSLNDSALLGMPTPSYMPMDPDGDGMDQQGRPMESQLTDAERMQAERDQQDRITSLRSTLNNQGSAFGSGSMGNPLARLGGIGAGLGSIFGYEDGGPVGMFLGGDPRAYGDERGRQDTSETARERVGGTTNVFEGDSTPGGDDDDGGSTSQAVNQAVAAAQQAEDKAQLLEDMAASQKPVDLTFSAPRTDTSGRFTGTDTDEFFANQNMAADQRLDDAVKSILAVDKTEQFDDLLSDVFIDPLISPQFPIDDFLARNPQPRETDPINPLGQLMAGDVVYNRGKDNERTVSRFADLENRMGISDARVNKGQGLSALAEPILSKVFSALGGSKATDIFDNVVNQNKQAIIAADTNQIVGYADDGPFGRVYKGRPGYNPFGADGASYTVDPQTGALIVNRQQPNQSDDDERALPQAPVTPPPATDPADTTPPPLMITPPTTGLPPSGPSPTDVLVPSTRTNVPITAPSLLPTQGVAPTFLPQSFLDLLASFNRPAPRAMQDGGAVLDKAADDFLEALKVA